MNIFEDESKEKYKKIDLFLENCDKLIKEIETKRKKEETEKKSVTKNAPQKYKETNKSQQITNHSLYNTLKETDYHKTPLTLLTDKQEFDDNQTYQKLMDLFIEENDTIKDLNFNLDNVDDYLILQLYTAFSLKARKIYLNSYEDKDVNEKGRLFMKMINNIQYIPNKTKLTNRILNFINNGILDLQHINLNEEIINANNYKEEENERLHSKEKDIPIIDAEYFYKKESNINTNYNYHSKHNSSTNINNSNHDKEINIELEKETNDEKIETVDTITIKPNIQRYNKDDTEKNRFQNLKNLQKVLEIDDKELEGLSEEKVEHLMQRIYNGEEIDNNNENNSLIELNDSQELSNEIENENILFGEEDYESENNEINYGNNNARRDGNSLEKMQNNFPDRNRNQQYQNYCGFEGDNLETSF